LKYLDDLLRKGLADENSRFLVAEDEGRVVGYISGSIRETAGHRFASITNCYVLEEERRKGVAKSLGDELIRWFCEKGAESATVKVHEGNLPGLKTWKSLGFQESAKKLTLKLK
jgi:ribosomal protein S18 acetylase RimI-like enzyme